MAVELRVASHAQDEAVARVVVAGHVDHGKSTLIGRLMYDLGLLHQSKIDDVLASSVRRGVTPEWSYVLDSLQEERDQAITIDTTRIWFSHGGRRYTIIDAPGHRQFLANMLSGASEADAAILVLDAAAGIGEQTLRHAYLLNFLGIRHVVVAANKIDLLDDPHQRIAQLADQIRRVLHPLQPAAVIPISATLGHNVAHRAASTPWYHGPTLVEALAAVRRGPAPFERPVRVPVQDTYRRGGERIVVGTLAGGELRAGHELTLLPAGVRVTVERLAGWPQAVVPHAAAGDSVGIVLDGDRFAGRGDVLADPQRPPIVARDVDVEVFWLDARVPSTGETLRLRRGTQTVAAVVSDGSAVYDIEAAELRGDGDAHHNIVRMRLRTATPIVFDRRADDATGARCVLLRGERVVAIGFTVDSAAVSSSHEKGAVSQAEHERRNHHRAGIVRIAGAPQAEIVAVARAAERDLFERGISVAVVDGSYGSQSAPAMAHAMAGLGHVVLVAGEDTSPVVHSVDLHAGDRARSIARVLDYIRQRVL